MEFDPDKEDINLDFDTGDSDSEDPDKEP